MIGYPRPPRPKGFPDAEIQAAQQQWEAAHDAWLKQGRPKPKGKHIEEPVAHWKQFRPNFYAAQQKKCGFCESKVFNQIGPIDHFAPKGEVNSLVPGASGREHGDGTVQGRKEQSRFLYGYWGQAFDWDNWLLVCERCNTGWKRSFFAVAEDPMPEPKPGVPYTPLLLSPFFDDPAADPEQHLEFTSMGGIVPRELPDGTRSPRGQTTIDLVGLDRPSLTEARLNVAEEAERWCNCVLAAWDKGNTDLAKERIEDLKRHAQPKWAFAGAVRSRIRHMLGVEWTELDELVNLPSFPLPLRP